MNHRPLPPDPSELQALADHGKWDLIIQATKEHENDLQCPPAMFFFAGKAHLALGASNKALALVEYGLSKSPTDNWGHHLRFEIFLSLGLIDRAFEYFGEYIKTATIDVETSKATYVYQAVEHDRFDLASQMNEKRLVISEHQMVPNYAIALQCFVKADTLERVLLSLVNCLCTKEFSLVILQDNPEGSAKPGEYRDAAASVRNLISAWLPSLIDAFDSVEVIHNPTNKGTAPSCRRLLDRVASRFDGFIFIEDDCVLSRDALIWTKHNLKYVLSEQKHWFATCESVFFDCGSQTPKDDQIATLTSYAKRPEVRWAYIMLDFVPSTCFITKGSIWRQVADVRSFTRGPESLNKLMKKMGRFTVSPVVPRASDIGMSHNLGYSVQTLGRDNVSETKNTYLLSTSDENNFDLTLFPSSLHSILYSASAELSAEAITSIC